MIVFSFRVIRLLTTFTGVSCDWFLSAFCSMVNVKLGFCSVFIVMQSNIIKNSIRQTYHISYKIQTVIDLEL